MLFGGEEPRSNIRAERRVATEPCLVPQHAEQKVMPRNMTHECWLHVSHLDTDSTSCQPFV